MFPVRRFFACLLLAGLLGSAQAADSPPAGETATGPALEVMPGRRGYAADQPEIFIRQRLFGRAHGLSLLAAACLDLPAYSTAIQDAYAAWHAKQARTIETIARDLADYYFGPRAGEARWHDLSHALNLPDSIQPALGEVTLHAACASLPVAMPRSRYALDRLLAGIADAETLPDDVAAVPPAPTIREPAK